MAIKNTIYYLVLSFLVSVAALPVSSMANCADEFNNLVIRTIGRMLTAQEASEFCKTVEGKKAGEIQEALVRYLLSEEDFVENISAIFRIELLQGIGENQIMNQLLEFDQIKLQPYSEEYGNMQFDRLTAIYYGKKKYLEGEQTIRDLQISYLNNYLFEEINMGDDNFVNAAFLYLLGRQPTIYEMAQSTLMCQKQKGRLFFQEGESKEDFLHILTLNENYYEFQIKYWYERLLLKQVDHQTLIETMNAIGRNKRFNDPIIDIIEHLLIHQL